MFIEDTDVSSEPHVITTEMASSAKAVGADSGDRAA